MSQVIDFDALSADELTDVAWGLGAAHHYTDRLFDLEAGLMRVTPGRLRPLHAATALWAFARLDWVPSRMLAAIGSSWRLAGLKPPQGRRRVEPVLPNMTARQLGTCSWALAALQQTTTPCFEALWVELCSRGLEKLGLGTTLRTDTLMQIHQTHLSLRLDSSEISEQMTAAMKSPSGAALLEKSSKTWQELSRPVHGQRESSQQREIANTLSSLGHFHVVVGILTPALSVHACHATCNPDGKFGFARRMVPLAIRWTLGCRNSASQSRLTALVISPGMPAPCVL